MWLATPKDLQPPAKAGPNLLTRWVIAGLVSPTLLSAGLRVRWAHYGAIYGLAMLCHNEHHPPSKAYVAYVAL